MIGYDKVEDFLNTINWPLAIERGVTPAQREVMEELYTELWCVCTRPSMYCNTGGEAVEEVRKLEEMLQRLWKFDIDRNFHRYHFMIKGCTCPKMDNEELFGTDLEIYLATCPFHGDDKEKPFE